jgi:hypothetical protein
MGSMMTNETAAPRRENIRGMAKRYRAPKGEALTASERAAGIAWWDVVFYCENRQHSFVGEFTSTIVVKGTRDTVAQTNHICSTCENKNRRGY